MPAADLLARLPSFSLQLHPPFLSSNRVNRTDNASPTLFSRDLLPFSLRLSFPKPTSRRKPPSKSKSFIVRSHSFIRSSKFARFSFFFFSLFLATRFSEFSSSNERATLGGGVTKKKTRKGNRLRSSAQHLGSTVWNTARFVRCSAYVRVVESAGCRRGERNKGACPPRRRRIQLHSPSPCSLILPPWIGQYFLRVRLQRENTEKAVQTGYCGARFVVARFYKFAGIKRKNAVCLDVRAHRPLPPSLSSALPNPLRPLLSPSISLSVSLVPRARVTFF